MNDTMLHRRLIVLDGLVVSRWSRELFLDMRRGGLTAANCTCCVWENFHDTMDNIAKWKKMIAENDDLLTQIYTTQDIRRAKAEEKTGILLGFQNLSAIEDRLEFLSLFKELGVGIAQMAYNTQNFVGSGCYESSDGGLSDFGYHVVAEMNRVGILCDLSHVGARTSEDVIRASTKPVCYSHCLPAALKPHPRNKSDEQLRFIAERGGFIGVTMFPPFLAKGVESTVQDYVDAIEHVIGLVGEDCVGIGTDFTQDHDLGFFEWITHDKGVGRRLTEFGEIRGLEGFASIGEFPNLTAAMQQRGWKEERIGKVMGENWLRVLGDVWAR